MKIIILVAIVAVTAVAGQYGPPPPSYPAPPAQPAYAKPSYPAPPPPPAPYSFEWAVQDAASANDYNHKQSSDGQTTNAVYRTLLPDGRVQVVTIKVVGDSGSIADVQYETPKYAPAPAYKPAPAPAYKPAPAPAPQYPAPSKY